MADTIETSLTSVLNQIDDTFEVIVVDDGSTDQSVKILERLKVKYPNTLRVVKLNRKFSRKLGETRNISIHYARGQYVILHIDTDDIWDNYIISFVKIFKFLEKKLNKSFMLSGEQINIAPKKLLTRVKYRNTQRAQDRDLWLRLLSINRFYKLEHKRFFKRLPREKKHTFLKSIKDTYNHLLYDFRRNTRLSFLIKKQFIQIITKNKKFTIKGSILKLILIPFAFVSSKFHSKLLPPKNIKTFEQFKSYREKNTIHLSMFLNDEEKTSLKHELGPAHKIFFE